MRTLFIAILSIASSSASASSFEELAARAIDSATRVARTVSHKDLGQDMLCYRRQDREPGIHVIRDAAAFQTVAGTPSGVCPGAQLPAIDFSKRTVLAAYAEGGGCSIKFERSVVRDDGAKKVVFSVIVREINASDRVCLKMGMSMNWVSVPTIPADYAVEVVVSKLTVP